MSTADAAAETAANVELVRGYIEGVFGQHRVAEVAAAALREDYREHNPTERDGRDEFVRHFSRFVLDHPDSGVEILAIVGEGETVAVLSRWWEDSRSPGVAVTDIYRVEGGMLAEHWDVIQPLSADSPSAFLAP